MAYVYRYIDTKDNIIKYVGIVWSKNRTLRKRIEEHRKNDDWCKDKEWRIEYLSADVKNRTDAEFLEAHYISLYKPCYNVVDTPHG